jgi:DNA-binding XRE family transcriptional regulator
VLAHRRGHLFIRHPNFTAFVLTSQDIYDRIFDMEVSNTKLRQLRQERAWSIRELSERAGVSTETIYSLEHGRRAWAWPRTVRKLAEALGVEPRELMKGVE